MIVYAIEFFILHSLFFLVYKLLLTNETQLNFRRFFLLGTTALSLILPLIHIPTVVPIPTINFDDVVTLSIQPMDGVITYSPSLIAQITSWLVGSIGLLLFVRFCVGLIKIRHWYQQSVYRKLFNLPVRNIDGFQNSFTFFRWVFIDSNHFDNAEAVVQHESGHSHHLHSLDIIFFNMVSVLFWWSPSIWLMIYESKKVHEFQADAFALKSTKSTSYIKTLVQSTLNAHGLSLASSFDDAPIVKRLKFMKMMKRKMNPWKIGSVMAIVVISGAMLACEDELDTEIGRIAEESNQQIFYSDQVAVALKDLNQRYPNTEFTVIETMIENKESLDKISSYDPNLIKYMSINEDGDYKTLSVILVKGGDLHERAITVRDREGLDLEYIELDESYSEEHEKDFHTIVEEIPEFPGGKDALYSYIASNIKYPAQARKMGIEGRVYVRFIVEKDGSVTNVTPVKGIGAGCDAEAVRVMKEAPNFSPGRQKGKNVRVQMSVPIVFKLDKEESSEFKLDAKN